MAVMSAILALGFAYTAMAWKTFNASEEIYTSSRSSEELNNGKMKTNFVVWVLTVL